MLTENQSLFLKHLRSGEYRQCQFMLRRGDRYCASGVALDALCGVTWVPYQDASDDYIVHDSDIQENVFQTVMNALDFDGSTHGPVVQLMVHLNDIGVTFSEIADFIESIARGEMKVSEDHCFQPIMVPVEE